MQLFLNLRRVQKEDYKYINKTLSISITFYL